MKRMLTLVAAATLAVAMARLVPAHAANHDVDVYGFGFNPRGVSAPAGDTITWGWSGGPHNVTSYSGQAFASPTQGAGSTYSITFGGGTASYYCTLHATVDGTGDCQGMCGFITDQPVDLEPPVITIANPQSNGIALSPVTISGTATDDTGVTAVSIRVTDLFGGTQDFLAGCTCPGTSVAWSKQVSLSPGIYRVTAYAIDAQVNIATASVGFIAI